MMTGRQKDYRHLVLFTNSKTDYEEDFTDDNNTLEPDAPSEDESYVT